MNKLHLAAATIAMGACNFAGAQVLQFEGMFDSVRRCTLTQPPCSGYEAIKPFAATFQVDLAFDPTAPVSTGEVVGVQSHRLISTTLPDNAYAPRNLAPQQAWDRVHTESPYPLSEAVFNSWQQPNRTFFESQRTTRVPVLANDPSMFEWRLDTQNRWLGTVSGSGVSAVREEFSESLSIVLNREANFTLEQANTPVTYAELRSFFEGFVASGEAIELMSGVSWGRGAIGDPTGYAFYDLTGDFRLVSISTPVPEPQTYAMMLAGLAAVGVMARRKRKRQTA